MSMHRIVAALSVAALVVLTSSGRAEAQKWGTVKGTVVLDGPVPAPVPIVPDTDAVFCNSKGPFFKQDLVVDPKTKGVRWVMVWLLDESGNFDKAIPIHPKLAKPEKSVLIDQPCCAFEPHALCIRKGQVLVAKNSAMVTHNVNIIGGDENPNKNIAIPPGKSLEFAGWKASPYPVPIQCTIHKWMNCYVRVFDHPYSAVTNEKGEFEIKDAPVGKYRIVVWQESIGWVVYDGKKSGKVGIPIEIKPEGTDLGAIKLTLPAKK